MNSTGVFLFGMVLSCKPLPFPGFVDGGASKHPKENDRNVLYNFFWASEWFFGDDGWHCIDDGNVSLPEHRFHLRAMSARE